MKAKPTNWHELLQLAKVMFESGKHQADLREKFGDVKGQKLFYLLLLNQAFPGVKLFDLTDKELMQLHFTELIQLGNRSCSDSLARIQRHDATAGRELTQPLTEKEFSNWIDEQLKRPDRMIKEEPCTCRQVEYALLLRNENIVVIEKQCTTCKKKVFRLMSQDQRTLERLWDFNKSPIIDS